MKGTCPMCNETHTSTYKVVYQQDGRRYLKSHSPHCTSKLYLVDTPESLARSHAAFRRALRPFTTEVIAAVRAWAAATPSLPAAAAAVLRAATHGWAAAQRWYFVCGSGPTGAAGGPYAEVLLHRAAAAGSAASTNVRQVCFLR